MQEQSSLHQDAAAEKLSSVRDYMVKLHEAAIEDELAKLAKVSDGMLDGSSWLGDKDAATISVADAIEVASGSLFKQRGLRNEIAALLVSLGKLQQDEDGDMEAFNWSCTPDLSERVDKCMMVARVTKTTAQILSCLRGDLDAKKPDTKARVQECMNGIHADGLDTEAFVPSVIDALSKASVAASV